MCYKEDTTKFKEDFDQLSVKVPPSINLQGSELSDGQESFIQMLEQLLGANLPLPQNYIKEIQSNLSTQKWIKKLNDA